MTTQYRKGINTPLLSAITSKTFGVGEHQVDTETIGQFIGLYDKNGTKIFEGDIVKDWLGNIAKIVYKPKYSVFVAYGWENGCGLWFDKDIEVIGNIYDNTELLEIKNLLGD